MDSAGPDPQDALVIQETQAPQPITLSELPPTLPLPTPVPPPIVLPPGAAGGSILLFEPDRARLAPLLAFNRRRVRWLLWLLLVGLALSSLWLLPKVHALPLQRDASPLVRFARDLVIIKGQLWWVVLLRVLGVVGPLLAVISLCGLPTALWREARLRRQSDLHLAVGRQGVLFFLPGQSRRWFLLPWEHMLSLNEETIRPDRTRGARLRTVLWRRWARLQRLYRHGRKLNAPTGTRRAVPSPFAARAALQQPWLALHVLCTGRLPATGYHWLFRLALFTPRAGPTVFRLETGWFAALQSKNSADAPTSTLPARRGEAEASLLHLVMLALWRARPLASTYPALPLPRSGGAFHLGAPTTEQPKDAEDRRRRLAAWAMLPLLPLLSLEGVAQSLAQGQTVTRAAALSAGALSVLALGIALLLIRVRHQRLFLIGAVLLALGGLLNAGYGLAAFLIDWPWRFTEAPGQPFMAQEMLAGLLIILGALALALGGYRRPGLRQPITGATRPLMQTQRAEVVLGLGLLLLGVARVLEDVNLAVLSQSDSATLQFLRNTLAEPLLPLAILGVCYFGPRANPTLKFAFRVLQVVYGLVLAVLVPAAFLLVHRALGGAGLPLPWLPMLVLMLLGGLLAAWSALFSSQRK